MFSFLVFFDTMLSWLFFYCSGYSWPLNVVVPQASSLSLFLGSLCIHSLGHCIYFLIVSILIAMLMTPQFQSVVQCLPWALNPSIWLPSDIIHRHLRFYKSKKEFSAFSTNVYPFCISYLGQWHHHSALGSALKPGRHPYCTTYDLYRPITYWFL